MNLLDDAMLALIARFVVTDVEHLALSEEKFLQHQFLEVKNLIKDVPPEERQQVVIAWISEHAERYRNEWQKKVVAQHLLQRRCADCPLQSDDTTSFCIIHSKWSSLLKDYIAGNIESDQYVEETLQLLEKHKAKLKVTQILSRLN